MGFAFAFFCGCVITVVFAIVSIKFVVPLLDRINNCLDGDTK